MVKTVRGWRVCFCMKLGSSVFQSSQPLYLSQCNSSKEMVIMLWRVYEKVSFLISPVSHGTHGSKAGRRQLLGILYQEWKQALPAATVLLSSVWWTVLFQAAYQLSRNVCLVWAPHQNSHFVPCPAVKLQDVLVSAQQKGNSCSFRFTLAAALGVHQAVWRSSGSFRDLHFGWERSPGTQWISKWLLSPR